MTTLHTPVGNGGKRRRAARRPLGVARYTGTRSVQMADNGFVDRRHPQLVHRLTRSTAWASRSSTRRSSTMTSIIRWPSPPKTTAGALVGIALHVPAAPLYLGVDGARCASRPLRLSARSSVLTRL
jgi:hypothetical protein